MGFKLETEKQIVTIPCLMTILSKGPFSKDVIIEGGRGRLKLDDLQSPFQCRLFYDNAYLLFHFRILRTVYVFTATVAL